MYAVLSICLTDCLERDKSSKRIEYINTQSSRNELWQRASLIPFYAPTSLSFQAPLFFWSLDGFTSLVSILGAIAMAISSWNSSLHA